MLHLGSREVDGGVSTSDASWNYVQSNGSRITLQGAAELGEEETRTSASCGWRLQSSKWVLFWLCWAGAIQGMVVNGFVNVVITTIERRFDLRSTETGLVAGAYDVASFLCLVPVSYFGGSGNKPRWLGWGMVVMGMGSVLFAVPHFTSSLYNFDSRVEGTCSTNGTSSSICSRSSSMSDYKYMFVLAQLLHGAGAAPLYTLGVTFIDENVTTKMSSVYIGIYYSMAIVGPAIGYLAGGQFLTLYVDVGAVDSKTLEISPSSGVWVGAWWIGFLLSSFLSFVVSVPIMAFPRELPGSRELRLQKISEAHRSSSEDDVVNRAGFGTSTKDLPKSLEILTRNPTFMFLNAAGAFEGLLLSGFAAFLPKFIESQFNVAASWSAILVGCVTVTSGGGGTFLGGYLVKRFQLRCAGIIKMCVACSLGSLFFCLLFIFSCPNVPFAGVNTLYHNSSSPVGATFPDLEGANCSANCHCSMDYYDPVCGADNVMYYSPCFAGCIGSVHSGQQLVFTNCSCVALSTEVATATRDLCKGTCGTLPVFLALAFVFSLFTFLSSMPALSATLRCVADNQRSFALGIQWIIVRLLGSIPAPIIFGFLVDLTCTLWQDSCGNRGSCRVYNNETMSRYMLVVSLVGKVLSTSCFFLASFFYEGPAIDEEPGSNSRPSRS